MGAIGHTQLGIDLLVVPLDGLVAEVQAIRDLSVSETVGKQAKNRSLPFRQRLYQRCLPTVAHGGGEGFDGKSSHTLNDSRVSGRDFPPVHPPLGW